MKKFKTMNRIDMFDGLKGLSILAIIIYYFFQHLLPGGFLAVNTFFVVAGFFNFRHFYVKDINRQPWDIKGYYKSRFKRLFFPLLFMVISVATYILLFNRDYLYNLRGMGLSSLLFANNYYQIMNKQSYFVQAANPSPYTHLWYVALLGQLILLTPLLMKALYSWNKKPSLTINFLVVLGILSAFLLGYWYKDGSDPTNVYYNLLTRAFSYLFGGALGLLYPSVLKPKPLDRKVNLSFSISSIVFMLLAFFMLKFMYGTTSFTYRFGMLLFTLCSIAIIVTSMHPQTLGSKILSFKPFVALGRRSYSYYLWFYPVLLLFPKNIDFLNKNIWLNALVKFIVIVILAEITYQIFERDRISLPIGQDFNWNKTKFQFNYLLSHKKEKIGVKIITFLYIFSLIIAVIAFIMAPETKANVAEDLKARIEAGVKEQEKIESSSDDKDKEAASSDEDSSEALEDEQSERVINHIPGLTQQELMYANALEVTFIGDSQLLASTEQIKAVFPKAVVDGEVGRQLYQSLPVVNNLKEKDAIKPTVVTYLGANGSFTPAQIDDYIKAIGEDKEQYYLTVNVDRVWNDEVNKQLYEASQRFDNIKIIDWGNYVKDHPEWLSEDRVHLTVEGAEEFARFIAQEVYRLR